MACRNAWLWGTLLVGFALAGGCELNPQPEVPEANGTGGVGGGAGSGVGGTGANTAADASSGGGQAGALAADCMPACGSGELCVGGACLADPCEPNACAATEACKPSADFSSAKCGASCAGVVCQPNETCASGQCVATGCSEACDAGEACLPDGDGGYACQPNPCASTAAADCGQSETCEPKTNSCVTDPCVGVKCPAGQVCRDGECQLAGDGG